MNKDIAKLNEFKLQHKNVLKHCMLGQKYLRYDYVGLLILRADDAERHKKIHDDSKQTILFLQYRVSLHGLLQKPYWWSTDRM